MNEYTAGVPNVVSKKSVSGCDLRNPITPPLTIDIYGGWY